MPDLLLGLIGDNIASSKAPLLHHLAGRLCGFDVHYERLVPREMGADFDAAYRHAAAGGFHGMPNGFPSRRPGRRLYRLWRRGRADPAGGAGPGSRAHPAVQWR
jgi:hypothetical protein